MTSKVVYAVQSFGLTENGKITPDAPQVAKDRGQAERLAEALAQKRHMVVAFSRRCDPEFDIYGDPVVIAKHGPVPAALIRDLAGLT
ncbi:hypothetical protein [Kaistia sp. MMO-174]|uniref:hypothetical protein n=1 Tax=Kaistia sp. MMO-174 TaxID=3081256 RepID=UPI003019FD90